MRRILLFAMFLAMAAFVSCKKQDRTNNLAGTKWGCSVYGTKYIVEFTSDDDVLWCRADGITSSQKGKYYQAPNGSIAFVDDEDYETFFVVPTSSENGLLYIFKSATVSGDLMLVETEGYTLTQTSDNKIKMGYAEGKTFYLIRQ